MMSEALKTNKTKLKKMADLAYAKVVSRHNIDQEVTKLAQHIKA